MQRWTIGDVMGDGMPDQSWPWSDAPFDADPTGPDAEPRWQAAIEHALLEGTLRLDPQGDHAYTLTGHCPRCGHHTSQHLQFGADRPGETDSPSQTFRIACNCDRDHHGRPNDQAGCGWAPTFTVDVGEPLFVDE